MLDKPLAHHRDRLRHLVRQIVEERPTGRPDRIDSNLQEAGLTSLDMVRVVLDIEREFGITIEPDDMEPENFATLDALQLLVQRLSA